MIEGFENRGMGWLRDYPSISDYTIERDRVSAKLQAQGQKDSIKTMLSKVGVLGEPPTSSYAVDLRYWCSPIENQENLGSCTAHAGIGLVEYFERRAFNKHIDASRLFLYKVTRNLMHCTGDTGAFCRDTMSAMTLFGVPPEEYLPYNVPQFDQEPSAFCYSFAQSYQAISYYRLDPPGTSPTNLLYLIKHFIAYGLPSMFGFAVCSSINQAERTGRIPFPTNGEWIVGGHAVDAVGYDDTMQIQNTNDGSVTTGALLIRNSWGRNWGEAGYGWLPYDYVLAGLAVDFWSLLENEWVDTGQFGLEQTLEHTPAERELVKL
ncbi:C1 family peptidase [Crocosphaera sp.]|uniref:C1 family peptidase n=1 Tax=Crocosphaera sp. TaxID=2729996 RepID=UPI003F215485|nr:C1 family peptidase [Crocosphaera sp.]